MDKLLQKLKKLSLEELAVEFKQKGDTCALFSIMFSTAMLGRKSSYITKSIEEDINSLLTEKEGCCSLRKKITPPILTRHGLVMDILQIENIADYLLSVGYKVETYPATRENVELYIKHNPAIVLNFNFPEWIDFYGGGTLNDWYVVHVICAVDIIKKDLVYFEPLVGEIRKRKLQNFDTIYGKEIALIKPL
ncbi:MAG TPA: hypothetical protein VJH65_00120 [Candidatus Nanoarchaeia archaeon]|nr:hypothetical protein [Candidatus Nanoarchaeia archaeon]